MNSDKRTAVHEMNAVNATSDFLDVNQSLSHVIEVSLCSIADFLVLPISKSVCKAGRSQYRACVHAA